MGRALIAFKQKHYLGRLSEVRKTDREVAEAALFVEGLFGRPLRNDPKVLDININPFTTHRGGYVNLPIKFKPALRFLLPKSERSLWTRTSCSIHELVHSEDIGPPKELGLLKKIGEYIKRPLDLVKRTIMEGRAVFAQQIQTGQIKRFDSHFSKLVYGIALTAASVATKEPVLNIPAAYFLTIGVLYWPFHNALCTLANKVGDPVKAFKMTTEKWPNTVAILFPSRYYRQQIEAAKEHPLTGKNG